MMHPNSLRVPFLASLSLGTLLTTAPAQTPDPKPQASVAPGAAKAPAEAGLPTFLLLVPAGSVETGLEAEQLVTASCQAALPSKPDEAPKVRAEQVKTNLRRSASLLGAKRTLLPAYYLAKHPVTNAQYRVYLEAERAAGDTKLKAPFHWWRYGRKDDYDKKLEEIAKLFPGDKFGPISFWERFGHTLPYAVVDEKGAPIDNLPVVNVSYRDANAYAARLGMRLMSEAEHTRASRGDGKHLWPTAKPGDAASDCYTDQVLKDLQMFSSREKVLKPVGTVPAATGPFGHCDLFGNVWQFVGDLGFRPINGVDLFAAEWKALQKNKVGQLLAAGPDWDADYALAKGGSYLSHGEPMQLLIDARTKLETNGVFEAVGFRLAKSPMPGYDAIYSTLRGVFSRAAFAIDQDIDLAGQTGIERYELDAAGSPTGYSTVSFAPVNWLGKDRGDLQKLVDRSQTSPLLLGALLVTDKMLSPAAPAGAYSVLYRKAGVPRELVDAQKQGHKELAAAAKAKPKDEKEGEGEKDAKDGKKDKKSWRDVMLAFGLTEKDFEKKEAAEGNLKYVRIDGIEIPTDDDMLLLQSDGKVVAAWKAPNAKPAPGTPFVPQIAIGANDKGKAHVHLHVGMPLSPGDKRVGGFHMLIVLDREAPPADKPWRVPVPAK